MAQVRLRTEQVDALQAWLNAAGPLMRLGHWILVAKDTPPDGDEAAFAGTFIRDNSDWASLHLGDSFWEQSPVEQRETLTHELLHCHFYRLRAFTRDRLRKTDLDHVSSLEEIAIEQVARIVATLLPVPEIPA